MRADVSVVGASAAGLFSAWRLARAGRSVGVFERGPGVPRSDRTLIVTGRMLEFLEGDDSSVVNHIDRFELLANGTVASVDLDTPDLVIDRTRLLLALERRAESEGAEISYGQRCLDVVPARDGVTLRFGRR